MGEDRARAPDRPAGLGRIAQPDACGRMAATRRPRQAARSQASEASRAQPDIRTPRQTARYKCPRSAAHPKRPTDGRGWIAATRRRRQAARRTLDARSLTPAVCNPTPAPRPHAHRPPAAQYVQQAAHNPAPAPRGKRRAASARAPCDASARGRTPQSPQRHKRKQGPRDVHASGALRVQAVFLYPTTGASSNARSRWSARRRPQRMPRTS